MGLFTEKEKGYGAYKQSKKAAKRYVTGEGTTMGVGAFADPSVSAGYGTLSEQFQNRISGQGGPSLAELQMRRGMQQAAANQLSMAGVGGGPGAASARRDAMRNMANMQLGIGGESAMLRAREEEMARQQYMNMLGQQQQHQLGLEGLAAQNYATGLAAKRGQNQTDFGAGFGAVSGALGNVASGIGGVMTGVGALSAPAQALTQGAGNMMSGISMPQGGFNLAAPGNLKMPSRGFGGGGASGGGFGSFQLKPPTW